MFPCQDGIFFDVCIWEYLRIFFNVCNCWRKQDLTNVLPCQDIFLSKVYKSLATRKKRGHSKTIKQSSNSPSKVINIKDFLLSDNLQKITAKGAIFFLLKGGKHRCCQVQCWAAAVSGHENVKDSSHLMCFIVLT